MVSYPCSFNLFLCKLRCSYAEWVTLIYSKTPVMTLASYPGFPPPAEKRGENLIMCPMTYYVCPSVPHLAYLGYGTARLVDWHFKSLYALKWDWLTCRFCHDSFHLGHKFVMQLMALKHTTSFSISAQTWSWQMTCNVCYLVQHSPVKSIYLVHQSRPLVHRL